VLIIADLNEPMFKLDEADVMLCYSCFYLQGHKLVGLKGSVWRFCVASSLAGMVKRGC
jgi:hypothetical protein